MGEARERRIIEIMNEMDCDHDVAEDMFVCEILDRYGLDIDNLDTAEDMFMADNDEEFGE